MKTKVCRSCGFVGKPVHDDVNTFVLDVIAWGLWFVIAGITGIFPLAILGPLFTVYHLAVFRSRQCPKCHNLEMTSINSADGRHIIEPHEGGIHAWSDERKHAL